MLRKVFGSSCLILRSRLLSGVGRCGARELQLQVKQDGPELTLEPDMVLRSAVSA
jgi:hypothetical protein